MVMPTDVLSNPLPRTELDTIEAYDGSGAHRNATATVPTTKYTAADFGGAQKACINPAPYRAFTDPDSSTAAVLEYSNYPCTDTLDGGANSGDVDALVTCDDGGGAYLQRSDLVDGRYTVALTRAPAAEVTVKATSEKTVSTATLDYCRLQYVQAVARNEVQYLCCS